MADSSRKLSLSLLILCITGSFTSAHDSEARDFILMKVPYRHLTASPLPTTPDGNVDVDRLVVESSTTTLPNLTPEMAAGLSAVIAALGRDDPGLAEAHWGEFVAGMKTGGIPMDINALVQFVLRQSYMESTKELEFYASKVKYFNDLKSTIRDELNLARSIQATLPSGCDDDLRCILTRDVNDSIAEWEELLQSVGEDAQLANIDLQSTLQRHTQLLQLMSNVSKLLHDTAMNVIRKIGDGDDDDDDDEESLCNF